MGVYIRNKWYHYKLTIKGHHYYVPLKIHKGDEALLPARIEQVRKQIQNQHWGLAIPGADIIPTTLLGYSITYLQQTTHKKSHMRDKQRLLIIGQAIGDVPLRSFGKEHIQRLEKYLADHNRSTTTINRYMEVLHHLFNMAIEDKLLAENPIKHYQKFLEDNIRRSLTKDELVSILYVARTIQENNKNRTNSIYSNIYNVILLAINTGMRLGEIINLKREYINKENNILLIPLGQTKSKKRGTQNTRHAKLVYLNKIAMDTIENVTECHRKSSHVTMSRDVTGCHRNVTGYVFPLKSRNANVVIHVVRAIRKATGIQDFCFHQLRHTVSTFISQRVSIFTAKNLLGHADIHTTLKYSHPEAEEQRRGAELIEQYVRGILEPIIL